MFFLPLPIVLIELLVFTTFVHFYSFWDVFLAYLLPSFLGAFLFSLLSRNLMASMQGGVGPGELPADRVLHKGAILLGSILLIVPLFLTRVFALVLILPIFRHISIFIFKNFIFKRLKRSPFSFVQFGGFPGAARPGTGGFGQSHQGPQHRRYQGPFPFGQESPRQERDVEVVDITPLEITHIKTVDEKKEGSSED